MIRSRRRRRTSTTPEVTLTPLIDTALTLLVIFMVTAPLINNAIKVNLPSGKAQEDKSTQQELTVYLDEKSKIFFNGTPVSSKQALIKLLNQQAGNKKEQTVYVKADKKSNYGDVLELVDEIKMVGGISYVALATKRA